MHEHEPKEYRTISTIEIIRKYFIDRLPKPKSKITGFDSGPKVLPGPQSEISHIAIVLDGRVEDVIRAQSRLAALLLSEPDFIEYDPKTQAIHIGETKYIDGAFKTHGPEDEVEYVEENKED